MGCSTRRDRQAPTRRSTEGWNSQLYSLPTSQGYRPLYPYLLTHHAAGHTCQGHWVVATRYQAEYGCWTWSSPMLYPEGAVCVAGTSSDSHILTQLLDTNTLSSPTRHNCWPHCRDPSRILDARWIWSCWTSARPFTRTQMGDRWLCKLRCRIYKGQPWMGLKSSLETKSRTSLLIVVITPPLMLPLAFRKAQALGVCFFHTLSMTYQLSLTLEQNAMQCNIITLTHGGDSLIHFHKLSNATLDRVNFCDYLGIFITKNFSWTDHITTNTKKAYKDLGFLCRNLKGCHLIPRHIMHMSLMHSLMKYSSTIWNPYLQGGKEALQKVQRRAMNVTHGLISVTWEELRV